MTTLKELATLKVVKGYYLIVNEFGQLATEKDPKDDQEKWIIEHLLKDRVTLQTANTKLYLTLSDKGSLTITPTKTIGSQITTLKDNAGTYLRLTNGKYVGIGSIRGVQITNKICDKSAFQLDVLKVLQTPTETSATTQPDNMVSYQQPITTEHNPAPVQQYQSAYASMPAQTTNTYYNQTPTYQYTPADTSSNSLYSTTSYVPTPTTSTWNNTSSETVAPVTATSSLYSSITSNLPASSSSLYTSSVIATPTVSSASSSLYSTTSYISPVAPPGPVEQQQQQYWSPPTSSTTPVPPMVKTGSRYLVPDADCGVPEVDSSTLMQ